MHLGCAGIGRKMNRLFAHLREANDGRPISVRSTIEKVNLDTSEENRVFYLAQLRLTGLVAEGSWSGLQPSTVKLCQFLRKSLQYRIQHARAMAREIEKLKVPTLEPVKFSYLLHRMRANPLRYFRDLDFIVSREHFMATVGKLETLGIMCGDLDQENWSRYLMVGLDDVRNQYPLSPEAHFFRVEPIQCHRLGKLAMEVIGRWPHLNESQFYDVFQNKPVFRSFYDIAIRENAPQWGDELNELLGVDRYVAQFLLDAQGDVGKRRLGVNQVLELEYFVQRARNLSAYIRTMVSNFLYGINIEAKIERKLRFEIVQAVEGFIARKAETV